MIYNSTPCDWVRGLLSEGEGGKLTPNFFFEIKPLLGETNFTLGPI